MRTITTIGLDIAKSVFQFHGVNATRHRRRDGEPAAGLFPAAQ